MENRRKERRKSDRKEVRGKGTLERVIDEACASIKKRTTTIQGQLPTRV